MVLRLLHWGCCRRKWPAALRDDGRADARRQRSRSLEIADQRDENDEMDEVVERRQPADDNGPACWRIAADPAQHDAIDDEQPKNPFVDRAKLGAANGRRIEPG